MAYRFLFIILTTTFLFSGCGSARPPVPPGTIPQQAALTAEDEQYGHQVLSSLTDEFPLDTNDSHINRVRDIADRLAIASGNNQYPWHVHVLKGDQVKNAAATRGNYLFVWTGMFNSVNSDTELATIISHEMGHVLARHTAPNPQQEAAQILSGVMGMAAGGALATQGYGGPAADLARILIENVFQAALVNPQSQSDELEADHIGLFLMADAGYDPGEALNFWKRVQTDPDFQSASLAFFSSHPSTIERVTNLSQHLTAASSRYQMALGNKPPRSSLTSNSSPTTGDRSSVPFTSDIKDEDAWIVAEPSAAIHEEASDGSSIVAHVSEGTKVNGPVVSRRWVKVSEPANGFIKSSLLSPLSH